MQSIGADIQNTKKVKELLSIFEPDENGKKIIKLQVIDGKPAIDYEGGEK